MLLEEALGQSTQSVTYSITWGKFLYQWTRNFPACFNCLQGGADEAGSRGDQARYRIRLQLIPLIDLVVQGYNGWDTLLPSLPCPRKNRY